MTPRAARCRRKFLRFYPGGFRDDDYLELERGYKWRRSLLRARRYGDIAAQAVAIEARTNLLFSFEKMALRDAVRSGAGARLFAIALYAYLHGRGNGEMKFARWCGAVSKLPRRQTRVLTWPLVTVFSFIAQPREHIFLKPRVTQAAARAYGYDFAYESRPNWTTYAGLLAFAARVRRDMKDLRPRDMIDAQSFLWVQGSDEYEE